MIILPIAPNLNLSFKEKGGTVHHFTREGISVFYCNVSTTIKPWFPDFKQLFLEEWTLYCARALFIHIIHECAQRRFALPI